jgi:NAD(P)-dependent dehydrogenase (short-subunit alcohol dehydrogenase family)
MDIRNSVALVTGASRGLGRALTEALLERGARRVYATGRSVRSLETLVAAGKGKVVPLELDVTSAVHATRAAEQASDVELLINNAGLLEGYGVFSPDVAGIRHDMEANLFGVLHVSRAFAPVLEKHRGSALVNVLSVAALANMPAIGGYSSSKAAAWSLTQALRAELGPRGVSVHAVFPGPVDTDMIRAFEMVKTPASSVAAAILEGVQSDKVDIFPDPMSAEVGALFMRDPAAVATRFAGP